MENNNNMHKKNEYSFMGISSEMIFSTFIRLTNVFFKSPECQLWNTDNFISQKIIKHLLHENHLRHTCLKTHNYKL